jgi:2-keto-4-pentenoate hydratase/2-oxohepta-3-ene-1,7-dioic acid hydratase in catechol pathway
MSAQENVKGLKKAEGWLKSGDIMELEIEKLGTLRTEIIEP